MKEDRGFADTSAQHLDPATTVALNEAASQTREHAQTALALNPRDSNALLALCIVSGVQRDYLALVQHRLRDSYEYIKESQSYSSRLLEADPTAYDAYLSKGFTEYLVASLPFYLRWPMRLDNVSGTKQQGLRLAMFYLRENQEAKTEQLLARLAHDYPENAAFGQELRKLESHRPRRN